MRICKKCKQEKELSGFRKSLRNAGGHKPVCIQCINDTQNKKYREKNGVVRALKPKGFFKDRLERRLFDKYGTLYKDVFQIFKEQLGMCKICGCNQDSHRNNGHTYFAVDHCHKSGDVRGLLCMSCNVSLGLMDDSAEYLSSCIEYLNKTKKG